MLAPRVGVSRPPPVPAGLAASPDLYRFAGVGLHFGATIGFFAWLGYWADGKLGSSPWLLLVGVFLGFGLGLWSLVSKFGPRKRK
ncbi:MAG TPA: AtpZ/AtpI family protein [Planctomycetes bacterium]|nr:AtpZ/AtpI family protein [Planctomycetota bacterium]